MLHDPAYRQKYEVDLLREFPRLRFHEDFAAWAALGRELLELHIGFESAEPYPLGAGGQAWRRGAGRCCGQTRSGASSSSTARPPSPEGVPYEAWEYRLGSRSALEWVLDQYKERTPRDPTIRERFNTYRFADHKERVIDLLKRVCTVSVETVGIVDRLDLMTDIDPDEGLELRPEFAAELQASVDARAAGEPTIPWEEVKRRLGV